MDCGQGSYWAYALENPAGRFYVGSTDDLEQRVAEHNSDEKVLLTSQSLWILNLNASENKPYIVMNSQSIAPVFFPLAG